MADLETVRQSGHVLLDTVSVLGSTGVVGSGDDVTGAMTLAFERMVQIGGISMREVSDSHVLRVDPEPMLAAVLLLVDTLIGELGTVLDVSRDDLLMRLRAFLDGMLEPV